MENLTIQSKRIMDGRFDKEDNREMADKLRKVFYIWIDNGHNNFADENTIIICIKPKEGVFLAMVQDVILILQNKNNSGHISTDLFC